MITTPILVLIMSWFFLRDPLTWKKAIGVLTGAVGVWMLIRSGARDAGSETTLGGDLLIMGNAASYALFLVLPNR